MKKLIDDSVKQKLLDSLAKEPSMVISTAYAYAKNYVLYGVDITKAWTTVVEQAAIIEQIKVNAEVEAYDYFKKDYENCLKADMLGMLEDLKKEMNPIKECEQQIYGKECWNFVRKCQDAIQQKINALRGDIDEID